MNGSKESRTALVLGATGLIGSSCLRQLLDSDLYGRVYVITRRRVHIAHSRLQQVVSNFDDLRGQVAKVNADDIFCCLGTTMKKAGSEAAFRQVDYDLPLQAAEIGLQYGAKHYLLVSALGANAKSHFFYNQVKGELENRLKTLGYPHLTIARPSLLLGDRQEARPLEALSGQVMGLMSPLFRGPMKRFRPIAADAVASALIQQARAVVQDPNRQSLVVLESNAMQPD